MAYIGKEPGSGLRGRFIYTATAGQTSFTGADSLGRTLTYTDGEYTDVFLNGVKLDKTDYTATSGTSIVLDSGASADDTLEILAFDTFGLFSGEFAQDVSVGGDLTISDKIIHSGDTNTAIRFADADTVTVETAGSERLRVLSDGKVAIGGTTAEATLDVMGNSDSVGALKLNGGNDTHGFHFYTTASEGDLAIKREVSGTQTEVMRIIRSDGNLSIGKTSDAFGTAGIVLRVTGPVRATASGTTSGLFNRLSSDGNLLAFYKDSTFVGSVVTRAGVVSSFVFDSRTNGSGLSGGTNQIQPTNAAGAVVDDTIDLGSSTTRFDDVFATNTSIIGTSDANEKQQIASLTDAEITAAKALSKMFKTFKWNSAVESKGDNARTHTGHIAQEVQSVMTDAGLDVTKYAFWCSDTWWQEDVEVAAVEAVEAKDAVYDSAGNVVSEAVDPSPAQDAYTRIDAYETADEAPEGATKRTRLGVRYSELLAFIGAATEQRLADIETQNADFEKRLTALEN